MCVIIDANVAPLIFSESPHLDFLPVFDWLHSPRKDGRLVYGGKLAHELLEMEKPRRYLLQLQRAGRARWFPDEVVNAEEIVVVRMGRCVSDDPHIIALARISGARTLCSDDTNLHTDFTNPRLISKQRGHVYQNPGHVKLLRHTSSCGLGRARRR